MYKIVSTRFGLNTYIFASSSNFILNILCVESQDRCDNYIIIKQQ